MGCCPSSLKRFQILMIPKQEKITEKLSFFPSGLAEEFI